MGGAYITQCLFDNILMLQVFATVSREKQSSGLTLVTLSEKCHGGQSAKLGAYRVTVFVRDLG